MQYLDNDILTTVFLSDMNIQYCDLLVIWCDLMGLNVLAKTRQEYIHIF